MAYQTEQQTLIPPKWRQPSTSPCRTCCLLIFCRLPGQSTSQSHESMCAHFQMSLCQWHHTLLLYLMHLHNSLLDMVNIVLIEWMFTYLCSNWQLKFWIFPGQQCPIFAIWWCCHHIWLSSVWNRHQLCWKSCHWIGCLHIWGVDMTCRLHCCQWEAS